jgi:hypothetical protein
MTMFKSGSFLHMKENRMVIAVVLAEGMVMGTNAVKLIESTRPVNMPTIALIHLRI